MKKKRDTINSAILPSETAHEWSNRIVQLMTQNHRTEDALDLSKFKLTLKDFPAAKWQYYVALQEVIAKKIPAEHLRPTIHLQLRGNHHVHQKATLGLLGGVGPLSDASALDMLMQKLTSTHGKPLSGIQLEKVLANISLDLFSAPPPRKEAIKNQAQFARCAARYLKRLHQFFNRSSSPEKFFILSNTAHLNYSALNKLSHHRIVNLADKVVNDIQHDGVKHKNILVLGTLAAAQKKLYPHKLQAKNIRSYTPEKAAQEILQGLINDIKSGKNKINTTQKVIQLIDTQIKATHAKTGTYPTHILLSCTELPLALHGKLNDLTKHYRQQGIPIKFVNSEEIFVRQIYNFMHSLDQIAAHKATTTKPHLTHFHHQQTRHRQKSTFHTAIYLTRAKK